MPNVPPLPPLKPPLCPDCDRLMRFERATPDKNFANVMHVIFVCGCGRKSDQLIAKD